MRRRARALLETAYERKQRKLSGHHWWNVALSLKKMFF